MGVRSTVVVPTVLLDDDTVELTVLLTVLDVTVSVAQDTLIVRHAINIALT